MLQVIKNRRFFYLISGLLFVASIGIVAIMGLRPGIDFTGGSLLEISYSGDRPASQDVSDVLKSVGIDSVQIQAVDQNGYLLRMSDLSDEKRREILKALKAQVGDTSGDQTVNTEQNSGQTGNIQVQYSTTPSGDGQNHVEQKRFEAIGPVIGSELKTKSIQALVVVLVAIMLYVAWAFRKVSWPVESWKYGLIALIALFHDVFITFGIYTLLTHIYGWELNTAFVAAILTILGYSVNDTIVVFDRIRENLLKQGGAFEVTVNDSVNQTMSRSLITSLTTLIVLIAVLVIGGTSIQSFVAALAIGIVIGTYSSIFIASPLLVNFQKWSKKG